MASRQEQRRPGSVLLVDDEPAVHEMAKTRFTHWNLVSGYNVRQGIKQCQEIDELALAIVDLNMPGGVGIDADLGRGGGFEVVRRVREKFLHTKAYVLTAYTSLPLVKTSLLLGAEFVPKHCLGAVLSVLSARTIAAEYGIGVMQQGPLVSLAEERGLSHQKICVLTVATGGIKQKDIGNVLGISLATVKRHTEELLRLTGAPSLDELAAFVRMPTEFIGHHPIRRSVPEWAANRPR